MVVTSSGIQDTAFRPIKDLSEYGWTLLLVTIHLFHWGLTLAEFNQSWLARIGKETPNDVQLNLFIYVHNLHLHFACAYRCVTNKIILFFFHV